MEKTKRHLVDIIKMVWRGETFRGLDKGFIEPTHMKRDVEMLQNSRGISLLNTA